MEETTVSVKDALVLIEREESHFWDHKSAKGSGAMVEKIGSALANADGGDFIVGVEDSKAGQGLDRWQGFDVMEHANFVHQALTINVVPPIPYSVEWLRVEGRSEMGIGCLVSIQKSENVHRTSAGRVYVRKGAQTLEISGQAITDLTLSKGARSYEDQVLDKFTTDDLISQEELRGFLESYSPATAPRAFVEKQRLVDRDTDRASVAAAILYGENPSAVVPKRCAVKVARYDTKDAEPRREHLGGVPVTIEGPAREVINGTLRGRDSVGRIRLRSSNGWINGTCPVSSGSPERGCRQRGYPSRL